MQQQLKQKHRQLITIKNDLNRYKQLQSVKHQNRHDVAASTAGVKPAGLQDAQQILLGVLCDLEQGIRGANIDSGSFVMQNIRDSKYFVIYPTVIDVQASYKNILVFVNKLLGLKQLVTFRELELRKENSDAEILNAHFILEINMNKYELTNNAAFGQALDIFAAIKIMDKDIFSKPHNIFYGLNLWAIKELQFLGMVKKNDQVFGVISDPLGAIHQVAVGDKLGLKQDKIAVINERGIFFVNSKDNIWRKN